MRPTINSDAEPEHKENAVVSLDEKIEHGLQAYRFLKYANNYRATDLYRSFDSIKTPFLEPVQIDILLQRIINETPREKVNNIITGVYLSKLMNDSYMTMSNDFVLTLRDTRIAGLATNFEGRIQMLNVTFNGVCGAEFARNAQNCIFTVFDIADSYIPSKNCTYRTRSADIFEKIKHNCSISVTNKIELYDDAGKLVRVAEKNIDTTY